MHNNTNQITKPEFQTKQTNTTHLKTHYAPTATTYTHTKHGMTTNLLGILIDFFHPFYRLGGSWRSGSDVLAVGIGCHLHHRLLKVLIKCALLHFVWLVLFILIFCGLSLCLVVLWKAQVMSSFLTLTVSYPRHSLFNLIMSEDIFVHWQWHNCSITYNVIRVLVPG